MLGVVGHASLRQKLFVVVDVLYESVSLKREKTQLAVFCHARIDGLQGANNVTHVCEVAHDDES